MEIIHLAYNLKNPDPSKEDIAIKPLFKERNIDRDTVKSAVFNRIEFPLSNKLWRAIDKSFEKCWNKEIGRGGDVYAEYIAIYIYNSLVSKSLLLDYSKVEKIVEIILDYIKMTGGFLDEPDCED